MTPQDVLEQDVKIKRKAQLTEDKNAEDEFGGRGEATFKATQSLNCPSSISYYGVPEEQRFGLL